MKAPNFREEVIAELVAQKKYEYDMQLADRYSAELSLGRDDIRKKYAAADAQLFSDVKEDLLKSFVTLFKDSQRMVAELTIVDRAINRYSSDIGQINSSLKSISELADKTTKAYFESIPKLAQVEFLDEPYYDYNNERFVFYQSTMGNADYTARQILAYDKIAADAAQIPALKSRLDKAQKDLADAQNQKAELLSAVASNSAQLRELAEQLTELYKAVEDKRAENKVAMEKELDELADKVHAEVYGRK